MSSPAIPLRLAVLVDGEYAKKVLQRLFRRFPTHEDVMAEVHRMLAHPDLAPFEVAPDDLVPKIQQKGVDVRIGLDIASLGTRTGCWTEADVPTGAGAGQR